MGSFGPGGGGGFFEEVVDAAGLVGLGDGAGFVSPESEAKAALVGVIDMTMPDEGIDAVLTDDFLPDVGKPGGLEDIALSVFEAMDALLAEDDSAWFSMPEELGEGHVTAGYFEIFEGDVR